MCTFRVFGTLFWKAGRFWKQPYFRARVLKGNYVDIFFQVANNGYVLCRFQFCQPLPNLCSKSKSALLASMWLGLKPSWPIVTFTMCLLKDDMGTDDVTDMQLLICAKYPHTPYIALPVTMFTSIKEQGCCARYWRRSCFHAWLGAWLIFQMVASDSSSRIIRFFPLAVKCSKPCPCVTHVTTHKCLMHGTICGNTSWQN